MTLPTSRNDTLTPASTVPASLLNALQDQVVGAKRPPLWRWQTPQGLVAADVNLGYVADGSIIAGGAGAVLGLVPVTGLLVGDRITAISARVLGTGVATNVVVRLYRNNGDGTARTGIGTITIGTPPASWNTYTLTGLTEVVAPGKAYFLQADLPSTGQAIALLGVQTDRL
jgi:hypothetical protein